MTHFKSTEPIAAKGGHSTYFHQGTGCHGAPEIIPRHPAQQHHWQDAQHLPPIPCEGPAT
eukprot:2995227-Pyramimonas_sp.AAC.1